jgi:DNA polymerase III subunit gamma/tau
MAKAIYRIYRPKTFKEVSGQMHVVKTIQNQHASDSLAHAYLFTGPRGVGKTTTARLIAKLVNCENSKDNEPCNVCNACEQVASGQSLDVYEIDAASHTDVDNVRENIIKSVRFAPNTLKKKVYIIDEVHMLSTSAFNALLKTLEEPPDHVIFVLATTEIHKVPETIISRCQRFDFRRISSEVLIERMKGILKAEGVGVDDDVLVEVARHSEGCARDAESLLGQILALGDKQISMKEASLVLPATQTVLVEEFIETIKNKQAAQAIDLLNGYLEQGVDLRHFVNDVIRLLRDRLLESVGGKDNGFDVHMLQTSIDALLIAHRGIRGEQIPQLPVELAIVKMCGISQPPQDFKKQGVDSVRAEKIVEKKEEVIPDPVPEEVKVEEVRVEEVEVVPEPKEIPVVESVAVEAAETVFDTVPVIDIDEVRKKWPEVYEQLKSCNASLPIMMKACEVSGVADDRVELGFKFDLYVDAVNKDKNRLLIEGVLEKVLGKRIRIKAVHTTSEIEQDENIQSLVHEFGGSVI